VNEEEPTVDEIARMMTEIPEHLTRPPAEPARGYYVMYADGQLEHLPRLGDCTRTDELIYLWPFADDRRDLAWRIVVEATAANAQEPRIEELCQLWSTDNDDARNYAQVVGVKLHSTRRQWTARVSGSSMPFGRGKTARHAFATLAVKLGWSIDREPRKSWDELVHFYSVRRVPHKARTPGDG
jgi:hypothetical protein